MTKLYNAFLKYFDTSKTIIFNRRNKEQRMRVTNKARVEGSIVEATLIKEIATYCSKYFAEAATESNKDMHDDGQDNNSTTRTMIFDTFGSPLGRGKARYLDDIEYKAAHNYVLLNSPEIQPLLEYNLALKFISQILYIGLYS